MAQRVENFMGVRRGEGPLVFWTFLYSALIGVPRVFTFTCASALFLSHHAAESLPFVYMGTAVLIPLLGFFNLRVQRAFAGTSALVSSLSVGVVALLGLLAWMASGGSVESTGFVALLWFEAELALTGIAYWGLLNSVYSANQGKRLFGLVGTGEVLSAILGGLLAPLAAKAFGVSSLLWFSAAGMLAALGVLLWIRHAFADRMAHASSGDALESEEERSLWGLLRQPYVRRIVAMYAVPSFCMYYVIDNLWMGHVQGAYQQEAELAVFYGHFWAAYGGVTLLFRSLVAGRILSRVGVRGGLLLPPAMLLLLLLLLQGYEHLGLAGGALWVAIALKFIERVNGGSLHFPAYNTLYQPFAAAKKVRVLSLAETVIGPVVGLVTSGGLLLASRYLGITPTGLSIVALAAVPVYLFVAYMAGLGYRTALGDALREGTLSSERIDWSDASSMAVLAEGLQGDSPREVAYCVRQLGRARHPTAERMLRRALGHGAEEVRIAAYRSLELRRSGQDAARVLRAFEEERGEAARAAALRAAVACSPARNMPLLRASLHSPSRAIRTAALVSALHNGDDGVRAQAASLLATACGAPSTDERVRAAEVLAQVAGTGERDSTFDSQPESAWVRALDTLLRDPDEGVRQAACQAAAAYDTPRLWSGVVDNLSLRGGRAVASRALLEGGPLAIMAVCEAYARQGEDTEARYGLLRLVALSGRREALPFLEGLLHEGEPRMLALVLEGLLACGHRAADLTPFRALLDACLERLERLRDAVADIEDGPHTRYLRAALAEETQLLQARGLRILALCHPGQGLDLVVDMLDSGLSRHNDLAAELLDSASIGTDGKACETLLRPLPAAPEVPVGAQGGAYMQVARLLKDGEQGHSHWTWACIQDAAARLGLLDNDMRLSAMRKPARDLVAMEPMHKVHWLKRAELFSTTPSGALFEFARHLVAKPYRAGSVVFHEGDTGTELFVVISGVVRIESMQGSLTKALRLGSGDVFGELAALVPVPRTAQVEVEEDALLLEISADDLLALMETRPEVARGLVQVLADRLRGASGPRESIPPPPGSEMGELAVAPPSVTASLSQPRRVVAFRSTALFANVEEGVLNSLASRVVERRLAPGEVLFTAGEPGDQMYLVYRGSLMVSRDGRTIAEVGIGSIIGELAALTPDLRSADVTANIPCHLLSLRRRDVDQLMSKYPGCAYAIVAELVRRLRG